MGEARAVDFWEHAERSPHHVAVIDEAGREWSAAELGGEAHRVAHALRDLGVGAGGVVAVLLPKSVTLLSLFLATGQAGMYLVTLNPQRSARDLLHILDDSGAEVLIVQAGCVSATVLESVVAATGARCLSIGEVRGCTSFLDFVAQRPVTPPSGRIGGALLTYTSGTTGPPKGVLRQLRDVPPGEVLAPLTRWFRDTFRLEEHHGGVHLNTCPLHFSGPLLFTAYALNLGHTVVLMPAWHPRLALQLIERRRVTTAFMVPFQFLSLLKLPPDVRERYSRTSVKCVIHGSAPCPMEVKRQMLNWWGDIIFECYGATEVGGTVASPEEWRRYPGTVGKPYGHTEIRIYDEAGTQLPPLAPGRIFMRRAAVNEFVYKGDPAKTLAARLGEFVTVSDIGYLNEEGFLFLLDRRVDMITCRGEHIYPAQLESTLLMHPAVADCAFFGMPHPEWGSAVRAAVQLESGIAPSDTLAAQLLEFLETSTAASQCPSRIDFVESMPRDASGKLRRAEVRARFEAEGS